MEKTNIQKIEQQQRNYGVDLLRAISMYMVLILHTLKASGLLETQVTSVFLAVWFLEISAYCAVNCYALISGYVGIGSKYRYTNLVMLWLQVVLYSFLGNVLGFILSPDDVSITGIIKSFFPVLINEYWYFTAYFSVFLFIPLLNRIVTALNKSQAVVVCVLIMVCFSVIPTLRQNDDVFRVGGGYSVIWLALLYIMGACIQRFQLHKRLSKVLLLTGYIFSVLLAYTSKMFILYTDFSLIRDNFSSDILVAYTAPTILGAGVCLVSLFSKFQRLPIKIEKIVSLLASVSFGVYLVHTAPHVYENVVVVLSRKLSTWSNVGVVGCVMLLAGLVFVACAVIEWLRLRLVNVFRLKERISSMEERIIGELWKI